jgi:hypothetical protein
VERGCCPHGIVPVNPREKEKRPGGISDRPSCACPSACAQSSGSTFTILWSRLLPTQNVTGVVELSTNTVLVENRPDTDKCAAAGRTR